MTQLESDSEWLRRGSQRLAVAQVLDRPMTLTEIQSEAKAMSSKIQVRDVWFLIRQLERRGLVSRLNESGTGKLFYFTNRGRRVVYAAFAKTLRAAPKRDWTAYARIVRAKTRRLVLMQLAKLEEWRLKPTASAIRKSRAGQLSISMRQIIRALKELLNLGLVARTLSSEQRQIYSVSRRGREILGMLKHSSGVSEVIVSNPY